MKNKYIKIFTAIGLIAVVTLQVVWLINTYVLFEKSIYKEINTILNNALYSEAAIRFKLVPEGTSISGPSVEGVGNVMPDIVYLEDGLLKLGLKPNLHDIDSIATDLLKMIDIKSESVVSLVYPKTKEILAKSKKIESDGLGTISSEIIPIRLDLSEGIQIILVNPYYTIFERMGLLLISTVILMILIVTCIVYQIKIIRRQNKIARLRQDFSHAMTHDMKTPLSVIITAITLLRSGRLENKPEMKENYLAIMEDEAKHLMILIHKMLTLSMLEDSRLKINKTEVELQPMIDDLIEKFKIKTTKPISFIKNLVAKEAFAEEEYLKEVISNLIDNAIKYSKESVKIEISTTDDKDRTIIKIRDNGLGISEKDRKMIFEKYERAAATKRIRKGGAAGFGIGLNYVYQMMHAHGGGVLVDSIEGEYSEFILYMPKKLEEL